MKPSKFLYTTNFFLKYVGKRFYLLIIISLLVGMFDSLGITIFFPLLELLNDKGGAEVDDKSQIYSYVAKVFEYFNLPLTIQVFAIVAISLFLFKAIAKFGEQALRFLLMTRFVQRIRIRLVRLFGNLDYAHYSSLETGKITNVATSETARAISSYIYYTNSVIHFFTAVVYIAYVVILDYKTSFLVMGAAVIYFVLYIYPTRAVKKLSFIITKANHTFTGYLVQLIQNYKYLLSTWSYKKIGNQTENVVNQVQKVQFKQGLVRASISTAQEPLMLSLIIGVFFIETYVFETNVSLILLILILFYRSFSYFVNFQNSWVSFSSNYASLNAVDDMLTDLDQLKNPVRGKEKIDYCDAIVFQSVDFKYNRGSQVLYDLSFDIKANKTVALVGPSGSGKSTIADLVSGILRPASGSITLDGVPLTEVNEAYWRGQIGFVTQEPSLFSDTVLNNLTLWQELPSQDVEFALKQANALDFVLALPQGLNTHIGDRGVSLSGGQRQRLAIARELLKKPRLLLFDEATSALDSQSESLINDSIKKLHGQLTILMIAHRLSTVKDADAIHVLDKGRIIESGTFDELATREGGTFQRMVRLQELSAVDA